MPELPANILTESIRRLVDEFQPEEIWLFGSYAWGQPDADSDLDLLVVVRASAETPIRRAQRAQRCLSGIGIAKDVLVKTMGEVDRWRNVAASLEAEILAHGQKLYG